MKQVKFLLILLFVCVFNLSAGEDALKVIFVMQGRIKGNDIDKDEQAVAASRVESLVSKKLRELLKLRNFDKDILAKVRKDAEQWAALTSGSADDVRTALEKHKLDAFVRVVYRTAPVAKIGNMYSAAATLTAEIIDLRTAEKAALIESSPMGTPKNPAKRALDPFDSGMAALDHAAKDLSALLKKSKVLSRLKQGKKLTDNPSDTLGNNAKKVVFILKGRIKGKDIDQIDQGVAKRRLESSLDRRLKQAMNLRNFDNSTLQKVKQDAEQWAVLTGGSASEVSKILSKHKLDYFIRVYFRTAPVYGLTDKQTGATMYSGAASMTAEVIDISTGEKIQMLETPPMGTNEHPAKRALDPFDAGMSALDYASDMLLKNLKQIGDTPHTTQKKTKKIITNAKASVAVLWVKPEFGYWVIPRSRRPGGNRKARAKMKEFVSHVKKTGSIGVQVSDYLAHSVQLSGKYELLEQRETEKTKIQDVRNKLLEYRMAGWISQSLPREKLEFAENMGADFTLTARILKLWESSKSASAFLLSKGSMSGHALVEVTLTNVNSGTTQVATGTGKFTESGHGVIFDYNPSQTVFDKMMVGVAVKQALANAASKLGLGGNFAPTTATTQTDVGVMPLAINVVTREGAGDLGKDVKTPKFRRQLWRNFEKSCEKSSKFKRVPLPEGAEADEIIRKTILTAAGILPPEEFSKIKSFKLPERFLYGAVNIEINTLDTLRTRTIIYHADTLLRLVNGTTLRYTSSMGSADSGNIETAMKNSITIALESFK